MPVKTRGAIMRSAPGTWEVVDLVVDDPQAGELQVKLAASGLCHSDDHVATGDMPGRQVPVPRRPRGRRRRHRGRPRRHGLRGGRPRRLLVPARLRPLPVLRQRPAVHLRLRREPAGRLAVGRRARASGSRPSDGEDVGQMCGLGTFAEITTVDVRSTVKIDKSIPLEVACLVGCGVGTGWGTAVQAGEVRRRRHGHRHGRRRHRHQRRPGRGARRRQPRHRRRPGGVQAREGDGARRDRDLREHRGGRRLRAQRHQRAGRGQGAGHRRRAEGRARRPGVRRDRQGRARSSSPASATSPTSASRSTPACSRCSPRRSAAPCSADQNPSSDMLKMLRLYQEGNLKLDELITNAVQARRHQPGLRGHARRARTSAA